MAYNEEQSNNVFRVLGFAKDDLYVCGCREKFLEYFKLELLSIVSGSYILPIR